MNVERGSVTAYVRGLGSGLVLLCLYMPALQGSALGSGPSADATKTQPRTLT